MMIGNSIQGTNTMQGFTRVDGVKAFASQLVDLLEAEFVANDVSAAICVADSAGLIAHYKRVGDVSSELLAAVGYHAARMCKRDVQAYLYAKRPAQQVSIVTHLLSGVDGLEQVAVSICGPTQQHARAALLKVLDAHNLI